MPEVTDRPTPSTATSSNKATGGGGGGTKEVARFDAGSNKTTGGDQRPEVRVGTAGSRQRKVESSETRSG